MIPQENITDGQLYWCVRKDAVRVLPALATLHGRYLWCFSEDAPLPIAMYHILAPCIPPAEVMDMASTLRINAATEANNA